LTASYHVRAVNAARGEESFGSPETSAHDPSLPKLSLERISWPAMECIHSDKNLNQKVLLLWVREPITTCD
jgi:hypothetical protein